MMKRHIFTLVNIVAFVFAALLWVISVAAPDVMGGFDLAWAGFIVTLLWAISFTVRVFFEKQIILKKSWTILAVVFFMAAIGCIIGALALKGKLVLPIICLSMGVAVLIASLVLGGKKWDEGDNQKPGYKNYYERKAEKQALEANAKEEDNKE